MISERATKFEEDSAKGASGKSAEGSTSATNGKEKNNNYPGMEGVGDPLKVHVFNTFFLAKLQEQGYDKGKLGKWTKKVKGLFRCAYPLLTQLRCKGRYFQQGSGANTLQSGQFTLDMRSYQLS